MQGISDFSRPAGKAGKAVGGRESLVSGSGGVPELKKLAKRRVTLTKSDPHSSQLLVRKAVDRRNTFEKHNQIKIPYQIKIYSPSSFIVKCAEII